METVSNTQFFKLATIPALIYVIVYLTVGLSGVAYALEIVFFGIFAIYLGSYVMVKYSTRHVVNPRNYLDIFASTLRQEGVLSDWQMTTSIAILVVYVSILLKCEFYWTAALAVCLEIYAISMQLLARKSA